MAIVKKEVDNAVEVEALLQLVVLAVQDIKSGKGKAALIIDLAPKLGAALVGIGDVGVELKANPKAVEETVGRCLGDLADALLPAAQAASPQ